MLPCAQVRREMEYEQCAYALSMGMLCKFEQIHCVKILDKSLTMFMRSFDYSKCWKIFISIFDDFNCRF